MLGQLPVNGHERLAVAIGVKGFNIERLILLREFKNELMTAENRFHGPYECGIIFV